MYREYTYERCKKPNPLVEEDRGNHHTIPSKDKDPEGPDNIKSLDPMDDDEESTRVYVTGDESNPPSFVRDP